jgi:hypothetical protein
VRIKTYTTAPLEHDGLGTTTLNDRVGHVTAGPVREVMTPQEHVEMQRVRYAAEGHLAASEEEWASMLKHGQATDYLDLFLSAINAGKVVNIIFEERRYSREERRSV